MEIWQSVVLGTVQGLTEFLPVSSSGHIAFFQRVLNVSTQNALFLSLILHFGTLAAVCAVFYKDIIAIFKKPFKTLALLVLASVPAALVGFFTADLIEERIMESNCVGVLLGAFFMITAALLVSTEYIVKRRRKINGSGGEIDIRKATAMGVMQAVAVLPGVSRSGSTICAGLLCGGESDKTAKFSFLMSVPVILGGFVLEFFKGLKSGSVQADFAANGGEYGWAIAFGFISSAIVGIFAIKLMLKAVQKVNYKWFALYLLLLSVTCVVLNFTGHLGNF